MTEIKDSQVFNPNAAPDSPYVEPSDEFKASYNQMIDHMWAERDRRMQRERREAAEIRSALEPDPAMIVVMEYVGPPCAPFAWTLYVGGGQARIEWSPEPKDGLGPWQAKLEYRDAIGYAAGNPSCWRIVEKRPEEVIDNAPPPAPASPMNSSTLAQRQEEVQKSRPDLERELETLHERIISTTGKYKQYTKKTDKERYAHLTALLSDETSVDLDAQLAVDATYEDIDPQAGEVSDDLDVTIDERASLADLMVVSPTREARK